MIRETSMTVDHGLSGVFCTPDEDRYPDVAVVFLNAGLVHKVGPFRMWVDLARRLARRGLSSLRFDLGGLGDSIARGGAVDHESRALSDIQAALSALQQRGRRSAIVTGLCTGAVNAHRIAVANEQVRGVVALDGFNWPTPEFQLRRYASRMFEPQRLTRFVRRKLAVAMSPQTADGAEVDSEILQDDFPAKNSVRDEMMTLVQRRVRMLYVFTGAVERYCNYRRQLEDNFPAVPFADLLRVERFANADHTYFGLENRQRLFGLVESWMLAHGMSISGA